MEDSEFQNQQISQYLLKKIEAYRIANRQLKHQQLQQQKAIDNLTRNSVSNIHNNQIMNTFEERRSSEKIKTVEQMDQEIFQDIYDKIKFQDKVNTINNQEDNLNRLDQSSFIQFQNQDQDLKNDQDDYFLKQNISLQKELKNYEQKMQNLQDQSNQQEILLGQQDTMIEKLQEQIKDLQNQDQQIQNDKQQNEPEMEVDYQEIEWDEVKYRKSVNHMYQELLDKEQPDELNFDRLVENHDYQDLHFEVSKDYVMSQYQKIDSNFGKDNSNFINSIIQSSGQDQKELQDYMIVQNAQYNSGLNASMVSLRTKLKNLTDN